MNFWETVDFERDYRNMTRKELAYRAGFSLTSLSTGIKRNSIPAADVALRIASVLGVSVEYLLTGENPKEISKDAVPGLPQNYQKYVSFIEELESLPPNVFDSIKNMVAQIRLSYCHAEGQGKTSLSEDGLKVTD